MELMIGELKTNLNPEKIFSIWKNEKDSIFLDSSKKESKYSNFSFIGLKPFLKIKSKGNKVYINGVAKEESVFNVLNNINDKLKIAEEIKKEFPFIGGAIGYFSYDLGRTLEPLEESAIEDCHIYDSYFLYFTNLIIFDLKANKAYISSLCDNKEQCQLEINGIEKLINEFNDLSKIDKIEKNEEIVFKSNFSKETYMKAVKTMKDYILEGHIYIANMTQKFTCLCERDSYEIYKKLRTINSAPFSAYLNLEDIEIMSSSPERFLNIINKKVETRPIKGTRPRGKNEEEDLIYKEELINSEKDKSELLMIVDLERNDLSKVCKPGSIEVKELFKIEEYATVFHLVSTIVGELEEKKSAVDCIKECFPGGSITGTPKIRAMEVIEELEGIRRGLYTGAIGYFDLRGNCDFNIVIRTIVKKDNMAYFGVGGGITIESEEEMEYYETLDKAKALIEVLK